jgi:hypothetical protein
MMKIRMVEMHPPPNFQAAAPANNPRNGPCMYFPFASGALEKEDPALPIS